MGLTHDKARSAWNAPLRKGPRPTIEAQYKLGDGEKAKGKGAREKEGEARRGVGVGAGWRSLRLRMLSVGDRTKRELRSNCTLWLLLRLLFHQGCKTLSVQYSAASLLCLK